jgi:hypothetical protein
MNPSVVANPSLQASLGLMIFGFRAGETSGCVVFKVLNRPAVFHRAMVEKPIKFGYVFKKTHTLSLSKTNIRVCFLARRPHSQREDANVPFPLSIRLHPARSEPGFHLADLSFLRGNDRF